MKKIFFNKKQRLVYLFMATVLTFSACQKDSDGSPDVKPGNPVSAGINPGEGAGGVVITLKGSGLGDIRSIVFDKNNVPAPFTSTLNTENAIVFRVPDTAYGGLQNIVFTNSKGNKLSVPFKVIALPIISGAFPTDFEAGSTVTITGNNLDDVTKVLLEGTTTEATIVSKSRKKMVITMPASTVSRAKLNITNSSGDRLTNMDFVNLDNALAIFKDDYVAPAQSWSWGGVYDPSGDDKINGTKSLKAAYDPGGSWGGLQIGMGSELSTAGYKYFAFWAKGADVDKQVTLTIKGNNWSKSYSKDYTITAGKWTYFREDMSTFLPGMNSLSVMVFQIHDAGKTIYYDNIIFIK